MRIFTTACLAAAALAVAAAAPQATFASASSASCAFEAQTTSSGTIALIGGDPSTWTLSGPRYCEVNGNPALGDVFSWTATYTPVICGTGRLGFGTALPGDRVRTGE